MELAKPVNPGRQTRVKPCLPVLMDVTYVCVHVYVDADAHVDVDVNVHVHAHVHVHVHVYA